MFPNTPIRDPADRSGTDARGALIASLRRAVDAELATGDGALVRIAVDALEELAAPGEQPRLPCEVG